MVFYELGLDESKLYSIYNDYWKVDCKNFGTKALMVLWMSSKQEALWQSSCLSVISEVRREYTFVNLSLFHRLTDEKLIYCGIQYRGYVER